MRQRARNHRAFLVARIKRQCVVETPIGRFKSRIDETDAQAFERFGQGKINLRAIIGQPLVTLAPTIHAAFFLLLAMVLGFRNLRDSMRVKLDATVVCDLFIRGSSARPLMPLKWRRLYLSSGTSRRFRFHRPPHRPENPPRPRVICSIGRS